MNVNAQGRVPSRHERKRRLPAKRTNRRNTSVWVPVAGDARSRPGRIAAGLWIMVMVVGGAIVVMVEQMWNAVGYPLRYLGYAAYALTAIVLATGVLRGRPATVRRQKTERTGPVLDPDIPRTRGSEDIPLVLDAGTLDELRHAIESAFPELADGEPSRSAGS